MGPRRSRRSAGRAAVQTLLLGVFWNPQAFGQEDLSEQDSEEVLESSVFILPPNPTDPELSKKGEILNKALSREIERRDDMRWVPMDAVGMIHDVPADLYAHSCPKDEVIGCAYVLGDRGGADYAVATDISMVEKGMQLQVHLVDVEMAEAAFSFQLVLEEGNATAYGEGVARLIHSLAIGRLGKKDDIREVEVSDRDAEVQFNQDAAEELQQLASELGDVSTLSQRRHGKIERPRISEEDLLGKAQIDGVKPWERLNMSAKEYVRFQNSGLPLFDWRSRIRGRKGQVIIRPQLGGGRSWSDTRYYGQVVSSEETLEAIQTWAWQSQQLRGGVSSQLALGFGLSPELEVGVVAGVASGTYSVQIDRTVQQQTTTEGTPFDYPSQTFSTGVYARASALPDWTLRPALSAGISWWWGSQISDHDLNLPPDSLPDFQPSRFVVASVSPGVEARLSSAVDVVADLPILMRVGGVVGRKDGAGINTGLETEPLPDVAVMGFGIHFGIQVRMLGKEKSRGLDDYVD